MRAIVLREHGGPEVLQIEEVPDPTAGPDEIVVDVSHSALNRADTLQRMGLYDDPRNPELEIPGLEYAGTVAAVGRDVTNWQVGDRVMGIEVGRLLRREGRDPQPPGAPRPRVHRSR